MSRSYTTYRLPLVFFLVLLFLALFHPDLAAQNTFSRLEATQEYDGRTYHDYTIPTDALTRTNSFDRIEFGIRGGDGGRRRVAAWDCVTKAGAGAYAFGSFKIRQNDLTRLQPGGTIRMIVGEHGESVTSGGIEAGGGGGGTAVLYARPGADLEVEENWTILLVAGGGGGAYSDGFCWNEEGKGGAAGTSGSDGYEPGIQGGQGGDNGHGGINGFGFLVGGGHGGGGAFSAGTPNTENGTLSTEGQAGGITGGEGGNYHDDPDNDTNHGGYGFGGGGSGEGGGGGGGGYSGGGGGRGYRAGGGGGSFANHNFDPFQAYTSRGGQTSNPQHGEIYWNAFDDDETVAYPVCRDFEVTIRPNTPSGVELFTGGQLVEHMVDINGNVIPTSNIIVSNVLGLPFDPSGQTVQPNCDHVGTNIVEVFASANEHNGITYTRGGTCFANVTVRYDAQASLTQDYSGEVTCAFAEANPLQATVESDYLDRFVSFQWTENIAGTQNGGQSATVNPVFGRNNLSVYLTDQNGCSAWVNAESVTVTNPVTMATNSVEVQLTDPVEILLTADDIDAGSSAACGDLTLALSQTSFGCDDVGTNTVELSGTNREGQTETATATVNVNSLSCSTVRVLLSEDGTNSVASEVLYEEVCGLAADPAGSVQLAYGEWVNDRYVHLSGTQRYLTTTAETTLQITPGSDFTVSFWVNPAREQVVSGTPYILGQFNPIAFRGAFAFNVSNHNGARNINFLRRSEQGQLVIVQSSGQPLLPDQWTHVAAVRSGSTITLYLNGVAVASGTDFTNASSTFPDYPLTLGTQTGLSDQSIFQGGIDELRIWDHARTLDQLVAHRNEGLTGEEDGLILYANFEEENPDYYADLSGNGRHFDIVGDVDQGTVSAPPITEYAHLINVPVTITGTSASCTAGIIASRVSALPVELVEFSGRLVGKQNLLDWTAANEEAFDRYVVERSADGQAWRELGAVAGAMQVGGAGEYSFTDEHPTADAYYRLRMIDLDGSFSFSEVVHLQREAAPGELTVYPNPNDGQFTIALPRTEAELHLAIYTSHGTCVRAQKIPAGTESWRAETRLKPGIYLLTLTDGTDLWSRRILAK